MTNISNSVTGQLGIGSAGSVGGVADSRSSGSSGSNKLDTVSLSSAANLLGLARASANSRQAKIQNLSAEVKSGQYQPDNAQVSRSVIESHITGHMSGI